MEGEIMQRSHGWRLASLLLITLGLYGCPPEPADPPAQPDASMEPGGAGGAGAAGGAGGQGGAGAAGGAGGAGAAGGAGGAGAAGGEGGQGGAGGGAGGQGGAGAAGGAGGAGAAGGEGGAGGGAPECRRPVDCPAPGAPNCVATCEDGVCGIQCADACDCPAVYDPVCGADGNTYGNACEAACARVEVASRGECADGCVCPAVYDPVCGVDGNTYGNACEAACREVAVAAPGECQDDCVCPAVYDPVCGADGNTYGNACEAACARVRVVSEGECRADCPDPEDPAVMYHFDNPEECAEIAFRCAPGHTAFNDECGCGCIADPNACEPVLCELFCEFGFQVDRNGCEICACNPGPPACRADADCPAVPLPGCRGICEAGRCGIACEEPICPDPADPAVEYLSDDPAFCARAFFECAPGQRAFNDACGCGCIGPIEPEPCACPAIYDPVCGADGRTWGNACEAACARVEVIHPGECRPAVCPDPADPEVRYVSEDPDFCARARFVCEDGQRAFNDACGCGCVGPVAPDPCACPDLWDPVCGVDGNTYGNPCEARCRGVRVAHPGECRAQVCPDPAAPGVRYVSEDPAECAVIRFFCEPGERAFSDACGCGCIGEAPACGRGQIQVEGRCEQLCYGDDGCARGQRCNAAEVCLPDPGCPMCAVCAGWCEALPIE